MKGMAAATVPAVPATPPAAAGGCPGRTTSSAVTGTATVQFSKLGPIPDDAEGRTLYLPEVAKSTTPTGGATAVRRQRIRQQGRTRLIEDR
ncbi:hypothetical protein [Streptomyces olivochromogenes]|uniref:hypothetical protein n=1 Tax=Streptomyces olivochromogenes TaxID=1963 RepID=UPI0036CEBCC8